MKINNEIKDDKVTFQVAKILKEKDFNIKTNIYFILEKDGTTSIDNGDIEWIELDHNKYSNYYSRPTTALAIKWIRQNFGIHISAQVDYQESDKWMYELEYLRTHFPNKAVTNKFSDKKIKFDSPEQSENEAILHVLNNLI